jgi:hypothetical protein
MGSTRLVASVAWLLMTAVGHFYCAAVFLLLAHDSSLAHCNTASGYLRVASVRINRSIVN